MSVLRSVKVLEKLFTLTFQKVCRWWVDNELVPTITAHYWRSTTYSYKNTDLSKRTNVSWAQSLICMKWMFCRVLVRNKYDYYCNESRMESRRECERSGVAGGVATRSTDANLEIIGECGSSNVRGSFLPVQAIRPPSRGERPLGNSVEAAAHRWQWYFVAIHYPSVWLKTHYHNTAPTALQSWSKLTLAERNVATQFGLHARPAKWSEWDWWRCGRLLRARTRPTGHRAPRALTGRAFACPDSGLHQIIKLQGW